MTAVTRPALRFQGAMSPPLLEQCSPWSAMRYWFHLTTCRPGYSARAARQYQGGVAQVVEPLPAVVVGPLEQLNLFGGAA